MNENTIGCTTPTFGFEYEQGRTKHSYLFKYISFAYILYSWSLLTKNMKAYKKWDKMVLVYLYVTFSCRLFRSFLLEHNDIHLIGYHNMIQYSRHLIIPRSSQGMKIFFFSDSHLAPKFFKVVANSKKVGRHFQRQKTFFLRCHRSRN